ncbi:MAG: alpha/beta hydrolase [Candidatus Dojkabacteria bacterium]|nr:MAG: alpha/beta hydrolase [Candidatus Dojkabacteria bacterium]
MVKNPDTRNAKSKIQFPTSYNTILNGRKVSYFDTEGELAANNPNYLSQKPPLLLIHGWISVKEIFVTFIHELSHKYRVIAPDYPGFGWSEAIQVGSELDEFSDFTSDFIELLNLGKVNLYGGSLGGVLAAKFAAKYPDKTIKVVARATPVHYSQFPIYFTMLPARLFLKMKPVIHSSQFRYIFRKMWHHERRSLDVLEWDYWEDKLDVRDKVLEVMFDCFEKNVSIELARISMVYLQRLDLLKELRDNKADGLFMINDFDTKVKARLELYEKVPNYKIMRFSSKSHTSLEEDVSEVTRKMIEYYG